MGVLATILLAAATDLRKKDHQVEGNPDRLYVDLPGSNWNTLQLSLLLAGRESQPAPETALTSQRLVQKIWKGFFSLRRTSS